jgi:S-DNA-T family DNA segregation ATPase FtsK/SpoIIIE
MDRKKHEIWALCVLTIALLALFSIISFHANDRTVFNSSDASPAPLNWVGTFGAHLAWPLLFLFGIGSYGLVFTGIWVSWRLFRSSVFEHAWIQFSGIVLLLLSAVTLVGLHWPQVVLFGEKIETGGKIGAALSQFINARMAPAGSHILLIGIFLIALLLSTPLTLRSMWDFILEQSSRWWRKISDFLSAGDDEYVEDEEPEAMEDSPEPRVRKKTKIEQPPAQTEMFVKKAARKESIVPVPDSTAMGQYILPR